MSEKVSRELYLESAIELSKDCKGELRSVKWLSAGSICETLGVRDN